MEIRKVTVNDADRLLEIYAPYVEETAVSFEYEVPTLTEFEQRIKNISERFPYIKAVEDGRIVGYAYASTFKGRRAYDWSVETTIYVDVNEKGRGIGRLLYEALENALKQMGVLNMNACIAVPKGEDVHLTLDSKIFHEKMGFELVGTFHDSGYKFGKWYDMIWMEKMIGNHESMPKTVRFGDFNIV